MTSFDANPDICHQRISSQQLDQYYESSSPYYSTLFPADSQQTEIGVSMLNTSDENYWGHGSNSSGSPISQSDCSSTGAGRHRTMSPIPYQLVTSQVLHHHHPHYHQDPYYTPQYEKLGPMYEEGYFSTTTSDVITSTPFVRVVKRRNTANKKERRRTQSINSAFSYLRERIPNVPADTKLSKIKTLRLATSYISYLTRVLEGDQDPSGGFRAELVPSSRKINAERRANMKNNLNGDITQMLLLSATSTSNKGSFEQPPKKSKGRTGWPQDVWNSVLKQEQQ